MFYLGRPAWLTEELFADLQREAAEQREGAAQNRTQHFADLGPAGKALRDSEELTSFVNENSMPATASGHGNYRYYDVPKSHIPPHLDTGDFTINVTIMLRHEYFSERRSGLLLFPHGPEPVAIVHEPGEVIIFHAKEVVHARTPISDNNDEMAVNLGIGFIPVGEVEKPGYWRPSKDDRPRDLA
ncbi:MAG: hypothetical protein ACRDRI_14740 [Pseudonocardiaceae bacterium]